MTIPSGLVPIPLFVAFVLEVLRYYRLNPQRVFGPPFVFLAAPLVFFLLYLGLNTAGLVPADGSALCPLAALAVLALAVRRARLPKPVARGT
jgi:hypothetical protein